MSKIIPPTKYQYIKDNMPIPCVDVAIQYKGKYLLVKRNNEPLKDQFFTPGGRMHKGEHPRETAQRKIREELGVDLEIGRMIGVYNLIFDEVHSFGIIFLVPVDRKPDFKLSDESSEYIWSANLPDLIKDAIWNPI